MIDILKDIEKTLPAILCYPTLWNSLDVDYHPPIVKRVWTQIDDEHRLYLHEIHPCEREEALFHAHPWKSAVHVLPIGNGIYEHGVGMRNTYQVGFMSKPRITFDICAMQQVYGEMYYQMTEKNAAHYVRPIGEPVYTLMLTGKAIWKEENKTNVTKKLEALAEDEKHRILDIFKKYFK